MNLRLEFLAKLYFARKEGPEATHQLIELQRAACRSWLEQAKKQASDERETRPFDWLVHEFRIGQIEAMLTWLDTCREVLATTE